MANGKYINIDFPELTIYALSSIDDDNDIKYIGMTRRNPAYRLNNHIFEARHTPDKNKRTKWISSVNFKITQIILDTIQETDNVVFWEEYWISQIKSWGFELVNSNRGGGGLSKRSKEFSEWLSKRNIGNLYNLGKKRSTEAKLNISKSHIGLPNKNKGKKLSKEWINNLSKAKLGKVSNAKGFRHTEETKNKKRKCVIQIDTNGKIINQFNSVTDTAKYLNVSLSTISKILNKENKKYNNYIFKTKTYE